MKNVIIDTCVLIHIIRDTITGKKCIEAIAKVDDDPNIIISVVTKAEMESFVLQNNWGVKKIEKLQNLLDDITVIDINQSDIILLKEYAHIDSYSKRKINNNSGNLLTGNAKKMGKNDLWIAATSSALNVPLITCDADFDHLNGIFLEIVKVI